MILPRSDGAPTIEMSFQWPEHGKPLTLGAVEPAEGRTIDQLVDDLWTETTRVSEAVGLSSPARLQAIHLSWVSANGRSTARLYLGGRDGVSDMAEAFRTHFASALVERPPLRVRLDAPSVRG